MMAWRFVLAGVLGAIFTTRATAQQWFFNWDGTTDITCVPTIDGSNAYYQGAAANSAFYWEVADNGSGGKAFRQVVTTGTGFRWYGYGSRPEYYRGPCTTFAMENLRADRNAFTFAYRIKAESCSSTSNNRFFNCEFETTVPSLWWHGQPEEFAQTGGSYGPFLGFRIEFSLKNDSSGDLWLTDFRTGQQIYKLKPSGSAATWHTVWGTCELPTYPYANPYGRYTIWIDGVEVPWDDRDRGGWSDCEVGWTPNSGRNATFALDYFCYTYGAYPPGSIPIPAERLVAPTNSIAALKAYPDGTPCELTSKVVMGIYTDAVLGTKFYYLCEPDGTGGIKVRHNTGKPPHNAGGSTVTLAIGNVVSVKGGLNSAEGEKQISAHDITYLSAGTSPAVPLAVSNADVTNSYNAALYACAPTQLLVTAETGTVTSLTANTITDTSKSWATDQWKNMTVFLPAASGHPNLYYYVIANTSNTLTLAHRAIRTDFNDQPNLVANGVVAGNVYEFVGGKPVGPRLDGLLVRTTGTVTAVNTTLKYFDINDGGGSGDTRTLQDIWNTIYYPSVFVPPNGIRVFASSPYPAYGANVAVVGCVGTSRFKYQLSTIVDPNNSARDEVKIDKVMPAVWGQKWTAAPTAGNNGPICEGSTLNLTASTVSGGTYAWNGPNGFASSAQNPSIPNATVAASGEYSVAVTVNGLTSPATKTTAAVQALTQVTEQPSPQSVRPGQDTSFSVAATGHGTVTFQWKKGASLLTDDGHFTGSQTATLTIHGVAVGDAGAYRCEVTAGCGTLESNAATLTVKTVAADFDQDGDVDGVDYGIFAGCFNGTGNLVSGACVSADLNGDGWVDGADYGLFAGCFNGTGNPSPCQ